MNEATYALAGVLVTALIGLLLELGRRRHERALRSIEFAQSELVAQRQRYEDLYRRAMERLTAARNALHRACTAIVVDRQEPDYQPFSVEGSIDWAVDEAEAMRAIEGEMVLFGSSEAADAYSGALQAAQALRAAFGYSVEWDEAWADSTLNKFDRCFDEASAQMRRDLAEARSTHQATAKPT